MENLTRHLLSAALIGVLFLYSTASLLAQTQTLQYIHGSGLQANYLPFEESFKIQGPAIIGTDTIKMVLVSIKGVDNAKYQSKIDSRFQQKYKGNFYYTSSPVDNPSKVVKQYKEKSKRNKVSERPTSDTLDNPNKNLVFNGVMSKRRMRGIKSLMYEQEYYWINTSNAAQFEIVVSKVLEHDQSYEVNFHFLTGATNPTATAFVEDGIIVKTALENRVDELLTKAYETYNKNKVLTDLEVKTLLLNAYREEVLAQNKEVTNVPKPFGGYQSLIGPISKNLAEVQITSNPADLTTLSTEIIKYVQIKITLKKYFDALGELTNDYKSLRNQPAVQPHNSKVDQLINHLSTYSNSTVNDYIGSYRSVDNTGVFSDEFLSKADNAGQNLSTLFRSSLLTNISTKDTSNLKSYVNTVLETKLKANILTYLGSGGFSAMYRVYSNAQSTMSAFSNKESDNDSRRLATDLSLFGFNFLPGEDIGFTLMSGAKIYFFSVAKARSKPYQGWSRFSEKRMSLAIGALVSTLYYNGHEMKSLIPNSDINLRLYGAIGYDINKYVAVYVGASVFRQDHPDPLIEDSKFAAAPFVSFSIQTDLLSLVKKKK